MQLDVTQYSSDGVSHSAALSRLVAEASTLGVRNFEKLYNNAADVGLALINPRTGNVTRWYVAKVKRSGDDIAGWVLKPTPESIRRQPELYDYQFELIND